ncbi:MAG: choice-of-anchor J domain-containing protein [Ferruginibacter sp.]
MQSFITQRKITQKLLSVVFLTFLSMVICFTSVKAQTTITTSPPYPADRANAEITFNFTNNNTSAVALTSISSIVNLLSGNADVTGFYKPGAIAGPPGIINAANGWIQFATATVTATGAITPQPFFTSNLLIPAGATYGIAIRSYAAGTTTGALAYSSLPTPATFTAGGCTFTSGANVGFGGAAGGTAPTVTPRGFTGSMTFGIPCSGTPNPGNTLASQQAVCSGTPVTFTPLTTTVGNGVTYQWETSASASGPWTNAPGASTSASYTTTITATGFYRVRVTCAGNAGTSTPIQVMSSACTCLTPDAATICEGSTQRIGLSGSGVPGGPTTVSSGPIAVNVPDNNVTGITTPLAVVLPVGASITSMSVNLDMTHTFDGNITLNLIAPNGAVYNLINRRGGSGDNFVNTTISSAGVSPISGGIAPFTGTYSGDGAIGAGLTTFPSTVATFAGLYSVPNGTWRLGMRDHVSGDLGVLTSWSLTFDYVILPTATWAGPTGTLFSNAAGTTPYLAGTPANSVWVTPSATSTYIATIVGGPCAGANNSVITVLPRPVVSVTPTTGCSPLSLTASGAVTYVWTPSSGLNTATGAVVIANPTAITTYSVTGTGMNGCAAIPISATVNASPTAAVISIVPPTTFQIQEGFTTVLPVGWARQNLSNPLGAQNWGQGMTAAFNSFNGAPNAYAHNSFNSTTGNNTISSWLFTPVVNIKNGDVISFYTRTIDPSANSGQTFPDRLELRMSTNGTSVNAGTTNVSVGDYTNLLLTVNPTLTTTGYPFTWTQYTATVSGVTGTVSGRFAFRYFVTSGGPNGANSDNIGVDQVEYSTPVPFLCPSATSNLRVDITGGVGPFTLVYSNGTTNTTLSNYVSGTNIQVSPTSTTTYTVVSVTGANGCQLPTAGSAVTLTVTQPTTITTQPTNVSAVCGSSATFTVVTAGGAPSPITWEVRTSPTAPFTTVVAGPQYTGVGTASLTVVNVNPSVNGYQYRVRLQGPCSAENISNVATLAVTPIIAVVTPPSPATCLGGVQQLTIANIASPVPGSVTVNSTFTTPIAIPDAGGTSPFPVVNATVLAGINNTINVTTVPAGATVTGARVRMSGTHTYFGDLVMALRAPNGSIINLDYFLNATGGDVSTAFTNTVISSTGVAALSTGTAIGNYTGTFKADLVVGAGLPGPFGNTKSGPTGFVPTSTSWNSLLTPNTSANANGDWTLAIFDGGGGDVGALNNWSITIDYLLGPPATGVFTGTMGTMFTNAAATTPYTGTAVNTIYVKPTTVGVNNYSVVVTDGTCSSLPLTIPVTVNTAATGTISVANVTTCFGTNATFSFTGLTAGTGLSYQWQVSTAATPAFTDIPGATATTYVITGVTTAISGNKYRIVIRTSGCTPTNDLISSEGTLTVSPTPTVTIGVAPIRNLFPGLTTTLTAAVSPNATGAAYQWLRNGTAVAGATNNRLVVGIDALGTYTVRVTDANGCISNAASTSAPIIIGDSANFTRLFIYPSPNSGQFQVRYFNDVTNNGLVPSVVNVYDSKGARVFSKRYAIGGGYQPLNVDLGASHGRGIYRIDLLTSTGERIKTGTVIVM